MTIGLKHLQALSLGIQTSPKQICLFSYKVQKRNFLEIKCDTIVLLLCRKAKSLNINFNRFSFRPRRAQKLIFGRPPVYTKHGCEYVRQRAQSLNCVTDHLENQHNYICLVDPRRGFEPLGFKNYGNRKTQIVL